MAKLPNVHPGEVLKEEFLDPMGISALRFGRYFGVSARFWLGLQDDYDLEEEMDHKGAQIERIATHAS